MSEPSDRNVHWQTHAVNREAREALNGHRAAVMWFTGLSAAGKTTLANRVDQRLVQLGVHACLLDGDNVRHGLNANLGFSPEDREENVRRLTECAKLFFEAGLVVLIAVIAPYQRDRDRVRAMLPEGRFLETHVATPLAVCEERDPKGLYAKARRGEIKQFTGIDAPYEAPANPELLLDGSADLDGEVDKVIAHLRDAGLIPPGAPPR